MVKNVKGIYRGGKIELSEVPAGVHDETPVMVTFLEASYIDLRDRGIGEADAAELRARLARFSEDWESPEMDVYDNYDSAKDGL